MTPERWARVEALYHAAQDVPSGNRSVFLEKAGGDDRALIELVQALLDEPDSNGGLLDRPVFDAPDELASQAGQMAGQTLGGYQLGELAGAGGMGEVYRARDVRLQRDVAIKILPAAFTRDADRLARFEREARMLAALNHPNVCTIHGVEEAGGVRFLVLELVEGETLARRLASVHGRRGLPLDEALSIAAQIAEGLAIAHEKGIVHRDLKPSNVSINRAGIVKILDFGLAKPIEVERSGPGVFGAPDVPRGDGAETAVLGTPAYMSPEQARGEPVDRGTDIWAFGCVLYEMITGRTGFAAASASDSIAKILGSEPDWSVLPPSTPAAIRRLLQRALTKDKQKRLRNAREARLEIEAGRAELRAPRSALRRRAAVLGVVLTAGVAALALWAGAAAWQSRLAIRDPDPLSGAKFTALTPFEGAQFDASISPDGNLVTFIADMGGTFHAWLNRVDTGQFQDLTPEAIDQRNAGYNRSVGFSADGSEVWLAGGFAGQLRLVPLIGGTPRAFPADGAMNVAWSRDRRQLVYFTRGPGDPIFVADSSGGNPRRIFVSASAEHNHFPAWSPNGRWIYFAHGSQALVDFDIWRVPSSGGPAEQLTDRHADVRYVTPIDDRTLLFVAPDDDRSGPWLWALDVERRTVRRVNTGLERYLSIAASADGRRLVGSIAQSSAGLWSIPLLDRVAAEDDVKPYPAPTVRAVSPRFSGDSLFILSSRDGRDGLWRIQRGAPVEVWRGSDGALVEPPAPSPRGDRIAILLKKGRKLQLTLVSADGSLHEPLAEQLDAYGTAAWSPDGSRIVIGGDDGRGPGLFMIPVSTRVPVRIATGKAFDPAWSPVEPLIVYTAERVSTTSLEAIRPDGSAVSLPSLPDTTDALGRWQRRNAAARFLPDGRVVYLQGPASAQAFWLLDVGAGNARKIAQLSGPGLIGAFDIKPDGTSVVFDRVRERSNLVLIDLAR